MAEDRRPHKLTITLSGFDEDLQAGAPPHDHSCTRIHEGRKVEPATTFRRTCCCFQHPGKPPTAISFHSLQCRSNVMLQGGPLDQRPRGCAGQPRAAGPAAACRHRPRQPGEAAVAHDVHPAPCRGLQNIMLADRLLEPLLQVATGHGNQVRRQYLHFVCTSTPSPWANFRTEC